MGDGESGGSEDEKGEKRIELMNIRYVILSICILILFACAPTKVKIYPRETPPVKTAPEKSEKGALAKPVKPSPLPSYPEEKIERNEFSVAKGDDVIGRLAVIRLEKGIRYRILQDTSVWGSMQSVQQIQG